MVKLAQTTIRSTELSIAYSPCYSIVLMCYNGLHIPEGGKYEAQNLKLTKMFNQSKNVQITTKGPLLVICCYKQVFL